MSPKLSLQQDGKKFMWDGSFHATREEAAGAEESYRNENFETQVTEEDGKFLVYTRRVVKDVVVAAQ